VWIILGSRFFKIGGPSSSARSGRTISGIGYLVPQPFATGGNRWYPDFWAVIGDLRYPDVQDPINILLSFMVDSYYVGIVRVFNIVRLTPAASPSNLSCGK
jgi:hypothetical protein